MIEQTTGAQTTAGAESYDGAAQKRLGFFTDTSLCIGCKACEVACKEWNNVPRRRLRVDRTLLRQHGKPQRQ